MVEMPNIFEGLFSSHMVRGSVLLEASLELVGEGRTHTKCSEPLWHLRAATL